MTFTVDFTVRAYETDRMGHLNTIVYMQYAEHARWELLRAAGLRQSELLAGGVGPVNLETTVRFHKELLAGDHVRVSCRFVWGSGKSFRTEQSFRTPADELVAEVIGVGGLLDLSRRRLIADPAQRFRSLADKPELMDL
ncbi:acyl-CoA thioesterase [Mangrovihabitans endophyticus]|uniref:Thioesterase n=1 Tax=Mangrovihabitans endophyticus TaxID=1751298 RepID=A0A8J3BTE9_9ACTN|nr:acyl-CoA thioesterase [Mangrovihabitans endophyticus]GGK76002.1 thioesterase [Mangrovihabitans endophyticus]